MAQVHFAIEPAFSCAAAAAYEGIERPAVLSSVQPHADVLGENAVLELVFVPVFPVHSPGIAPFCRAMFFSPAVVAAGGEINPNPDSIGGNKKEDSFYTVLTPLNMKRGAHRRGEILDNRRNPARYGGRYQQGKPYNGDQAESPRPNTAASFIWLHRAAFLSLAGLQ